MPKTPVRRPPAARYPWLNPEPEGGFSSLGVLIALSLVITLVFTSSQVYWINSQAGDIQFAADAGALAAENVVAEYYVLARTADAVILTMTLFGMLVLGVSIILSLIPYCQELGLRLSEFAKDVFDVRNDIARAASKALTRLQQVLPFVAIANAALTVSANAPDGTTYIGLALLAPLESEAVEYADEDRPRQDAEDIEQDNAEAAEATEEAEAAKARMDEARHDGWLNDCGRPGRNMRERTISLAGLTDTPDYAEADWGFAAALQRARDYYQARLAKDRPVSPSPNEQRRYEVRRLYYQYALEKLAGAYAIDTPGMVSIHFPSMPYYARDMQDSPLYTESRFPVGQDGHMHGNTRCSVFDDNPLDEVEPMAVGRWGSLAELVNGDVEGCGECGMTTRGVGSVLSANTNTETGFEHWYREVERAAGRYQQAARDYEASQGKAKESAEKAVDSFQEALDALRPKRINPHPPGRRGCIVIVVSPGGPRLPAGLKTTLLSGADGLPPRMAISAAALAKDRGGNILGDFLEGLKAKGDQSHQDMLLGGADFILDVWGGVLQAYFDGVGGLTRAVGDLLRAVTGDRSSALATWAENAITEAFASFGLQPVELYSPKPLIVNSYHVASADPGGLASVVVMGVKQGYAGLAGDGSGTIPDMLLTSAGLEFESFVGQAVQDGVTLFTFSLGPSLLHIDIPIKVRLPQGVAIPVVESVQGGLDELRGRLHGDGYMEIWR